MTKAPHAKYDGHYLTRQQPAANRGIDRDSVSLFEASVIDHGSHPIMLDVQDI